MKVHFAVIMHEYGSTGFCATTRDRLREQMADWCVECGGQRYPTDDETIENYFSLSNDELYFEHDSEV